MEKQDERNQKGGALEGGLATEEALASSDSLLQKTRNGTTKGAQQYYSPPELAAFVKRMIPGNVRVLDPTAGDGSLLRDFDPGYSYGIELDTDQINNSEGSYKAIKGDFQHVYTLLNTAAVEFGAIVANPPFDLTWSDPSIEENKPMSSTKLTFIAMNRLLSTDGQMFFIAGRDRFYRECGELHEYAGVYALIEVDDLFDNVTLPCVIACCIHPDFRNEENNDPAKQTLSRDQLDLAATWAQEERRKATGRWNRLRTMDYSTHAEEELWKAVQQEYDKRLSIRLDTRTSHYDVYAEGSVLRVEINAYKRIVLSKINALRTIESLNRHELNYFRQNEAAWRGILEAAEDDLLTLDPALVERVDAMLRDNRLVITPLYPLKPIQRLGFLDEIDRIKCIRTDEEKGFYAGERYQIKTHTSRYEDTDIRYEENKKTGVVERKEYLISRRRLIVQIYDRKGRNHNFRDDKDNIEDVLYLENHFEIPDPGDVGSRFPDEVHQMRVLLSQIEWDTIIPNSAKYLEDPEITEAVTQGELEYTYDDGGSKPYGIRLRKFQREDLARMLVKGSGLLSWEQGLGKTLAALIYAEACYRLGAQDARLFIVPQDLIPQWQRECKRFMGRDLELIADKTIKIENPEKGKGRRKFVNHKISVHAIADAVSKKLRSGGTGWYITYHEALSTVGTKKEKLPAEVVKEIEVPGTWHPQTYEWDENGEYKVVPAYQDEPTIKKITSDKMCPRCEADLRSGYDGTTCRAKITDQTIGKIGSICGFTRLSLRVKPAASRITTAFQKGIIVVDEVTQIGGSASGQDSLRSKAVRGLRAKNRLGMTGTPIKNYINQAFWLLRWTVDKQRFSYAWQGGRLRFEDDFGVVQWDWGSRRKEERKLLPEITNLSMLWKQLASCMIRRRKEETGEELVAKRYHEHFVPLGVAQRQQMQKWMADFHRFFAEKYPESKVVRSGAHIAMAPMLGMMPKLEYACTMPLADPDHEWTGIEVSNFTPANFRVLELAMALAKEGRKVLVGSATKETGRWLAEQLVEKGVNAVHILDADGTTYSPKRRAEVVNEFQNNDVQVFCAGVQAIRLGHNLDKGSAVVLHGPPWDFETYDQFIARVHRLTSEKEVDIHVVLPRGSKPTINERKWALLLDKTNSTELALDGRLIEKDEERIDEKAVMEELVEAGLPSSADEVAESEIEAAWERMPELENYVVRSILTKGRTFKTIPGPWEYQEVRNHYEEFFRLDKCLALPVKAVHGGTRFGEITPEEAETLDLPVVESPASPTTWPDPEIGIAPFAGIDPDDLDGPWIAAHDGDQKPEEVVSDDTMFSESSPTPISEAPPPEPLEPDEPDVPATSGTSKADLVAALRDLAALKNEGILDETEFAEAKAALLAQLKEAA